MLTINQAKVALDKLDVWICSFGGCGTNLVANYLNSKGVVCINDDWMNYLCHYYTYVPNNKPTIYVYSDPIESLKSQKLRLHRDVNILKLSNGVISTKSDEALIYSMCCQFYNWHRYRDAGHNIMFIQYAYLFDNIDTISKFVGISMTDFPKKKTRISKNVTVIHEDVLREKYGNFIKDASE